MNSLALGELARRAALHRWIFTHAGLDEAVNALGWEVAERADGRVDLRTGGPFEPAWAMFDDGGDFYLEASLIRPVDVDPNDYDAVEDLEVEMYDLFKEAADSIDAAIGKASFRDGRAHPRFPEDEEGAEWLATWDTDTCRLSVKQLHEDQELPYRLSLVVEAPKPTGSP